ncbi:TRAP transporter small permease [Antarcticimicrobium luteum]|uniref:TRAP transporter small permease protein n=1 Tax=Antarcticimicrobium luteum TaxID=2547397 RepID=A0A4R5V632_9RHOB|nr:TRAP transporter small permease [Antarcticimicrobium luteum]TDK47430.1 TRAP transporter small permease [Antarcticimicrobium luteum]
MSNLNALFDGVLKACAALAGTIFAAIAAMISVNVVLRNLFGSPVYGLLDAVEYGLLVATFLGAPWVLWKRGHVTVDLVTAALPGRLAAPLARLTALIGLAACAALVRYAGEAALISAQRGSMIRTAFVIPEWWVLAVAPLGFALLALEFLRQMVGRADRGRITAGL